MNNSTYRFTLDLQKHQSQMSIAVFRYDTAVRLHISLTDGGKPYYIVDGSYAVLYGKRADGKALAHDCMINGNTEIIYDFEDSTTCVAGGVDCQIKLYGRDQKLITAPKFIIAVDERVVSDDDIIAEGGELSAFDEIFFTENERIQAEKERAEAEKNRKGVFICYSAYPDGTDFTESWSSGQNYIGVATSKERPTNKSEFEWLLFKGNPGPTGNGIESIEHTSTSGLVDTYTITFTDKSTTTFNVTNGDPRLIFSEASDIFSEAFLTNGTHGLLYYLYSDAGYAICAGVGDSTKSDIEIGSVAKGYPVTKVGYWRQLDTLKPMFIGGEKITSLVMPDSVTEICAGAFAWGQELVSVRLSKSLREIPVGAFLGDIKLTEIMIPSGVSKIGEAAFGACGLLAKIYIPLSIETIERDAFGAISEDAVVYYEGSAEDWGKITFLGTSGLENANINYNYNYGG